MKGKNEAVAIYEVFNADTPEIQERKQATLNDFNEAWELYRQQQFNEAKSLFQKCQTLELPDKVYQLFIDRCDYFLKVGPEPDWDGVMRLEIK